MDMELVQVLLLMQVLIRTYHLHLMLNPLLQNQPQQHLQQHLQLTQTVVSLLHQFKTQIHPQILLQQQLVVHLEDIHLNLPLNHQLIHSKRDHHLVVVIMHPLLQTQIATLTLIPIITVVVLALKKKKLKPLLYSLIHMPKTPILWIIIVIILAAISWIEITHWGNQLKKRRNAHKPVIKSVVVLLMTMKMTLLRRVLEILHLLITTITQIIFLANHKCNKMLMKLKNMDMKRSL